MIRSITEQHRDRLDRISVCGTKQGLTDKLPDPRTFGGKELIEIIESDLASFADNPDLNERLRLRSHLGANDSKVKVLSPSARDWLRKCVRVSHYACCFPSHIHQIFRVPLGFEVPDCVPKRKNMKEKLQEIVANRVSFLFGIIAQEVRSKLDQI